VTGPQPGPYGFGGRLSAEFPSQVIVDVTEVCNLACVHCPHPSFKQSSHYGARYLDPALNKRMVDEVRQHGRGKTQYIRYTGEGEPLIHPKAYDMLDYAVRNSGVFVTLTTNGTIMNEKRIKKLLASGIHMVDISIDAFTAETYAKIRVGGELEVTRANVLNLIRWIRQSGSKTKVVVSFIEQPENIGEAASFETFWTEAGADSVVRRRLHSAAGAVVKLADIKRKAAQAVPRYPCLYPWERILLNARGFLAFCPQDWINGSAIVQYKDTTIADTWRSEFYRKLRQAHLSNSFADHPFCGGCPDWQETRWPGQGASYADLVEKMVAGGGKS
jgi:pyruvate-formate lyase-activating enzyme